MKLTRSQLCLIIQEAKPDRFSFPSDRELTDIVAKKLSIVSNSQIRDILKRELYLFKRSKNYGDETVVLDSLKFEEVDQHGPPPPKYRKSLDDVSRRQVLRRTDPIMAEISKVAAEESVEVYRLLGLLLTRCKDKQISDIGEMLWKKGSQDTTTKLPIETALVMYTDCGLGRETYTNQKKLFASAGFNLLPSWNKLRQKQRDITPEPLDLQSPHTGVYFPLLPAVKITVKQIIESLPIKDATVTSELKLKIKFGFDGSGSHAVYNQSNNAQTNNIILTMFCPLSLEDENGSAVWIQEAPNSPHAQRPLCLQMGKESADSLQSLQLFNRDIAHLNEVGFKLFDKVVKVDIQSYMMDRKAADLYLGVGGAYCDLCSVSKQQCLDVDVIKAGFTIDRDVETLHKVFEDLQQEDGSVLKKKGDYDVRQGVTNRPIASPSQTVHSVQILHGLLRSFDMFMKTAIHVKAGVFDWSEAPSSRNKQFLDAAKLEVQGNIFSATGIKWDYPDKAGKGGTTTTGNVARQLLHHQREVIISQLPDGNKEVFRHFGQQLSVIIRVMSSKEKVNIAKYKQSCTNLYVFLIESFPRITNKHKPGPWISITPSLHKLLAHSWELIEVNDGFGLGALDEAGLEGCNKLLRGIRTKLSRKTSQGSNLVDTLRRMWIASDPIVNAERLKTKPICHICSTTGHSARCCKLLQASEASTDDTLFQILTTV